VARFAKRLRQLHDLPNLPNDNNLSPDFGALAVRIGAAMTHAMTLEMLSMLDEGATEDAILASFPFAVAHTFSSILYCSGEGPKLADDFFDLARTTVRRLGDGDPERLASRRKGPPTN
jgi:hypothetical protein